MSHFDFAICCWKFPFLSCPVQLWPPAVGNPLARDINRQFSPGGCRVCRRLRVICNWTRRLAFSSSQKKEKEDADEDEEDEETGHPAQQGLQGDRVKPRLGACLRFFGVALICQLTKGGGGLRISFVEETGITLQFKRTSSAWPRTFSQAAWCPLTPDKWVLWRTRIPFLQRIILEQAVYWWNWW